MDSVTVSIAPGSRCQVWAQAIRCGADVSVTVCGGSTPHVGAVSLAVYEPQRDSATVSTLTVFTHRDDQVAAAMAKALSRALKATVCVSAGLHVDGAGAQDLALFRENCARCCRELVERLTPGTAPAPTSPDPLP